MKKFFLTALLVMGVCMPASAALFNDGNDDDIYKIPAFEGEEEERYADQPVEDRPKKHKKKGKNAAEEEQAKAQPVRLSADQAEYDSETGDFYATGHVVVIQGKERIETDHAVGNMKTGDIYLEVGGALVEPGSRMEAEWVHYNFNNKTGELKVLNGRNRKDIYRAPHAIVKDGMILGDQGGVVSRCPAIEHPQCLSVKAKTFEIYPKERMIAHDVKVYVRGVHVYSRDRWINEFDDDNTTKIRVGVGHEGGFRGEYIKVTATQPLDEKTAVKVEMPYYSRAKWRPGYGVRHNARNFSISYLNGWDFDDDDWYYKQNSWRFQYKKHHFIDGIPLTYSGYFEYGMWQRQDEHKRTGPKSWHREYAVYIDHDPIYFSSKTTLNLRVGRKWVHESETGDLAQTDIYNAVLGQRLGSKWRTWVGYYQEDKTSTLFDLDQPDMQQEVRNGLEFRPDTKNIFTIVNRHDVEHGKPYEISYMWRHKFCCWMLEVEYEFDRHDNDRSINIHYYFDI